MERPTRTEINKMIAWAHKYDKGGRPWSGGITDRFSRIVGELEAIRGML